MLLAQRVRELRSAADSVIAHVPHGRSVSTGALIVSLGLLAGCTHPESCEGTGPYRETTTIAVEQQDFSAVVEDPGAMTGWECDQLCPPGYSSGCEIVSGVPEAALDDSAGDEGDPIILECAAEGVVPCI